MVANSKPHPANDGTPTAPLVRRMALSAIRGGKIAAPLRVFLYGVEGIGKSTFAAAAPSPIFIGAEDGTQHLDVQRFPPPACWSDVFEAIRVLETEEHAFKTVVFDTADWIEPLVWCHVCEGAKIQSIEELGFGKGYVRALDEWRRFLSALERLRAARKMHVIILGHSQIKVFRNPEGEDFDRYSPKLHDKAAGLIKEWVDDVLFSNFETFADKDSKTKRVRGLSTGARLIYTQRHAAYDAKNRHDLPESLPLSWDDFYAAATRGDVCEDPAQQLRSAIESKLGELKACSPVHAQKATDGLASVGSDVTKLSQLNNWINAQIAAHSSGSEVKS